MKKILSSTACLLTLLFVACTQKPAGSTAKSAEVKVVNLAIWTNFVTPEILSEFEKQTGIKVQVSNYSSNEELLAKIQAGAEGYDVAAPSDYMVAAMEHLGLLTEIDRQKITNFKDLDPKVLGRYYDPTNKFSVPFSWGTTGIAVNEKLTTANIRSWKDLFENKSIAGKFTLLDDVRETLGAALKMQALSLNAKTNAELQKGRTVLLDVKKRVKGFTSETLAGLVNGEMAVAHAYSCDALMAAQKTKGAVKYVIPEEGCTFWIDNLVIPKGAKHVEAAHKLIDFLLAPQVGVQRVSLLFSAPSNKLSTVMLSKEFQNNQSLFPTDKQLARCEMLEDLGDSLPEWDRIWTEVKATN
jgi:spermidine/putrescine-binding protein